MKQIVKKIGKIVMLLIYRLERRLLPVRKNVIIFESNVGRNYTGNPKAIYEEMVRTGMDKKYICVYILEDKTILLPGQIKKVKRLRWLYFYYMAVAKIWISDSRFPEFIIKRRETVYIQTWHGTPLKKLALDLEEIYMDGESNLAEYKKKFQKNSASWDFLISQNDYSSKIFRRCFEFHKQILEIGYPRNDVLFQKNQDLDIGALKEKLEIPVNKKVILYAPTWRDDQFYGDNIYKFATTMDYDEMQNQLGDEYVLLLKCHYLVNSRKDFSKYRGFIYSLSSECDISDLYLIADMLITDYSSVMFDYSLLKRPMLFFAYDLELYREKLRGFYFDFLNEIPGPISQSTEQLIYDIKHYNRKSYEEKCQAFFEKFNSFDNGTASRKITMLIKKIINNTK